MSTPFCGNPASVIILPSSSYSDALLQNIALRFNVSETAFITSLPAVDPDHSSAGARGGSAQFSIRWFTPTEEAPICAHATLMSAAVVFSKTDLLIIDAVDKIHFVSSSAGHLVARKPSVAAGLTSGMKFELVFPAGNISEANAKVKEKARAALGRTTGDQISEGRVGFTGVDKNTHYDSYIPLEVSLEINLANLKVDAKILGELYPPYGITVISQRARGCEKGQVNTHFFSSPTGTSEDPVTGSACSFAAKYWMTSGCVGIGESIVVNQVSSRGGRVDVVFDEGDDGETGSVELLLEVKSTSRSI